MTKSGPSQIAKERSQGITARMKKEWSTNRKGRPPEATSIIPNTTLRTTWSDPNLCECDAIWDKSYKQQILSNCLIDEHVLL